MKNILIAGGSGLIGSQIRNVLDEKGYTTAVLTRNPDNKEYKAFGWKFEKDEIDSEALDFADIIINLTGENISEGRWTLKKKENILNSRILATNFLFQKIKESGKKPEAFISASAIGYYGTYTSETIFTEDMPPGDDFLATTGKLWEDSVHNISLMNIRTVILRIGVVLSAQGGALTKMISPVKKGVGAALGSGKQYMPWIHVDDLAKMFLYFIEKDQISGIYNAVSPEYINNADFMNILADEVNKKIRMPNVPAFIMKAIFGEMSSLLLEGSRVSPQKVIDAGFKFNYKDAKTAMENLLN